MKYLKLYEELSIETVYYLTSSSLKRNELPKNIKSVLNLKLRNHFNNDFELNRNENSDIRDFEFEIVKYFDVENLQYENLKNNDLVIFHGGDVYEISNNIKKYKLEGHIKNCIQSTKYFVGISAGTVLLSRNSFLTKESTEIRYNHIHEDIAGIGIFDFGLNCHTNMLLEDPYFIDNFKKSLPKFNDNFYMISDGSYIKVVGSEIDLFGDIITNKSISSIL